MIQILSRLSSRLIRILPRQETGAVMVLVMTSMIAVLLLALRTIIQGRAQHLFLPWNLFLAWLPLLLSVGAVTLAHQQGWKRWQPWALAALWLLFLPNAPYIFTDLVHLKRTTEHRFWVDMIMILLFAWPGFLAGCISLQLIHREVVHATNPWWGWFFVFAVCALAGLGVYIGRFERWNSWDILTNPVGVTGDLLNLIAFPLSHPAHRFSILFGVLIFIGYATLQSRHPGWTGLVHASHPRDAR